MRLKTIIYGASVLLLLTLFSCESYLDKTEKQPLTFDDIWTKREYIQNYMTNVWGHIKKDDDVEDGHPYIGAADDAVLAYNRNYRYINEGTWSPSTVPYAGNMWPMFYKGIREANTFLANIDKCSAENVSAEDITLWKAEIRFARAYLNFSLYRLYGSYILLGDEIVDPSATTYSRARTPLEECEEYIETELKEIMADLPTYTETSFDDGRPTKGMCLALIGRLKLYAARPLFNGNPMYVNVKNPDGTSLYPATKDANKWKAAAAANKALIDFSDQNGKVYELYTETTGGKIDPYKSYQNIFIKKWNKEIIWGRFGGGFDIRVLLTPAVVGGTAYGGCSPTQEMVDAYAMNTGVYPITGYEASGTPIVDPNSGYVESGFSSFRHPIESNDKKGALSTYNMYINREPRFYVSVLWSGAWWTHTGSAINPVFAYNGNSGPGPRHDYPKSGYMVRKYIDPAVNSNGGGWGDEISWPMIRLAEIYLNYAEALNESEPSHPDILTYMNKVRERAGLPNIEDVYPSAKGNKEKMRELIKKERQIELFFECHRYFDVRQWMDLEEIYKKPVTGMNIMAPIEAGKPNVTPAEFWQRTTVEKRVFKPKHYLYPMPQSEHDRNSDLVQNYGW